MSSPVDVLIIGGGHAGVQAAFSLRDHDFRGSIRIVGAEAELPYQRPPLSKSWLNGAVALEDILFRPAAVYDANSIDLRVDMRAEVIDRAAHQVHFSDRSHANYGHLILATGSRPRRLSIPGATLKGVCSLQNRADAASLARGLDAAHSIVVIGGGFIGLEVAAAAAQRKLKVVVLEVAERVMQRAVSPLTSQFYRALHEAQGTRILHRTVARALKGKDGRVEAVELQGGASIPADLVVIGVGAEPVDDLAVKAGLRVENGVVVDEYLATSDPNISAIGDCARFPAPDRQALCRLESVQNASDQARYVAMKLVGNPKPYVEVPWFWTEQLGCKLQIVGFPGNDDEQLLLGSPTEKCFTVLRWKNGRFMGGEGVKRPGDYAAVRKIMASGAALSRDQALDPAFDLKSFARLCGASQTEHRGGSMRSTAALRP